MILYVLSSTAYPKEIYKTYTQGGGDPPPCYHNKEFFRMVREKFKQSLRDYRAKLVSITDSRKRANDIAISEETAQMLRNVEYLLVQVDTLAMLAEVAIPVSIPMNTIDDGEKFVSIDDKGCVMFPKDVYLSSNMCFENILFYVEVDTPSGRQDVYVMTSKSPSTEWVDFWMFGVEGMHPFPVVFDTLEGDECIYATTVASGSTDSSLFNVNKLDSVRALTLIIYQVFYSLINCKNVSLATIEAKKLGKKQRKQGRVQPDAYRVITIDSNKVKTPVTVPYERRHEVGLSTVSLRMGHLKTYTAEKPLLGKHVGTWFWSPVIKNKSNVSYKVKG